jgi:hypothetical protein
MISIMIGIFVIDEITVEELCQEMARGETGALHSLYAHAPQLFDSYRFVEFILSKVNSTPEQELEDVATVSKKNTNFERPNVPMGRAGLEAITLAAQKQ